MSRRKCGCVYADARNTEAVRTGYGMGGYLKTPCARHAVPPPPAEQDSGELSHAIDLMRDVYMSKAQRESYERILAAALAGQQPRTESRERTA